MGLLQPDSARQSREVRNRGSVDQGLSAFCLQCAQGRTPSSDFVKFVADRLFPEGEPARIEAGLRQTEALAAFIAATAAEESTSNVERLFLGGYLGRIFEELLPDLAATLEDSGDSRLAQNVREAEQSIRGTVSFKAISESVSPGPDDDPDFVETLKQALALRHEVDYFDGRLRNSAVNGRNIGPNTDQIHEERTYRQDQGFDLYRKCQTGISVIADKMRKIDEADTTELGHLLHDSYLRALRFNRESPFLLEDEPVTVMPIRYFRNFLRDQTERMYFLAMHGLPSAYDLFCCTFTETPRGYIQELHLHLDSAELTLILDGESECVWYRKEKTGNGYEYPELGRVKAGKFEAFRIPTEVNHTLHNPEMGNRNITVKLTMFIDDRIGKNEWMFNRVENKEAPVTVDRGERNETDWGSSIRYFHAYRDMPFAYRLDILKPGGEFPVGDSERFLFLVEGSAVLGKLNRKVDAGHIIRIAPGQNEFLVNRSSDPAVIFSVEGLDYADFLSHPDAYRHYSIPSLRSLRWSMR